jgi:hypothetical protein
VDTQKIKSLLGSNHMRLVRVQLQTESSQHLLYLFHNLVGVAP